MVKVSLSETSQKTMADAKQTLNVVVQDTLALRNFLHEKYVAFNTPKAYDSSETKVYNPAVFLRSDSLDTPGVYQFQTIGGKTSSSYGTGSNHKVVSDFWEKLIAQVGEVHGRAEAVYSNIFDIDPALGLTDVHLKQLDSDLKKLSTDVKKNIVGYFKDMNAFVRRIPTLDRYTPYYIYVSDSIRNGVPYLTTLMEKIQSNIDKLSFDVEPVLFTYREKTKLDNKVQQSQMNLMESNQVQTPRTVTDGNPGSNQMNLSV